MDEAVARAIAASPRLVRLSALETAAEAQARGARAERWPQVDLGAGYTRRSEVPELAIFAPTNNPAQPVERIVVFPNIQDNWRLRAGVGAAALHRRPHRRADRGRGRRAAPRRREDLRAGRADLVLETKSAYWSLVTARESQRVVQEAIRAYDAHLEDARNRERFGMAARNEVLAVEVERDRAELERLRAEAAADAAEANLQRLLDAAPGHARRAGRAARGPPRRPAGARGPGGRGAGRARRAQGPRRARGRRGRRRRGGARGAAAPGRAHRRLHLLEPQPRHRAPDLRLDGHVGRRGGRRVERLRRREALGRRGPGPRAGRRGARAAAPSSTARSASRSRSARSSCAPPRPGSRSPSGASSPRPRAAGWPADRYREGVIPSSELLDAELAHERAALARTEALAALRLAAAGLDRAVGRWGR